MNVIETHIEKVLQKYSQGEYYNQMLQAKELYFQITGKLNEEAPEFESRMNTFNDWYVFTHKLEDGSHVVDHYIKSENIDEELATSLRNCNYSLFLFAKINWKKQSVLKDLIDGRKIIMGQDNGSLSLVPDDLFIGRTVDYEGQSFLLRGICFLPRDILGILKKKAKKVKKEFIENADAKNKFLIDLENLKTKSLNYSHIPAEKIFT